MRTPPKKRFALDLSLFTLKLSKHAERMAAEKNFTLETIEKTFNFPERVYPNGRFPGQYRITGYGLCLTGIPDPEIPSPSHKSKSSFTSSSPSSSPTTINIPGQDLEPERERVRYFTVTTLYQDRVLTPPRQDQLDTPEGRRYAERYLKGLGRG